MEITGLVVALVALVVSFYSLRVAHLGTRNDVLAEVRDWGNEIIHTLCDAATLCDPNTSPPTSKVYATSAANSGVIASNTVVPLFHR